MNIKPSFVLILIMAFTLMHAQAQQPQPAASASRAPGDMSSPPQQILPATADQIARRIPNNQQIPVATADQITVNVLGEVNRPSRLILPKTGTLLDAIASAGGFTRTANPAKVGLIHKSAGEKVDSIKIDMRKILAGTTKDTTLRDGDTVVVGQSVF